MRINTLKLLAKSLEEQLNWLVTQLKISMVSSSISLQLILLISTAKTPTASSSFS